MRGIVCWIGLFLVVCQSLELAQAQRTPLEHEEEIYDDLAITYSQKIALDKFKQRVIRTVPQDYMKDDIYLIRWLRARDFNVKAAEEFLIKNLEWRKINKMDGIIDEDFSDIMDDFPVYVDTYDKKGQPIITAVAGQWDMRQSHVTGRDKRMFRYMLRVMEKATNLVREAQQDGKNITRFDYVLNLDGFNMVQHGCPRCMLTIFDVLRSYEQFYPGMIDKIVIINAPPTIRVLFGPLVRSAVSGGTIGSVNLKIIGTNQNEWKRYLMNLIDENQLTEEFGGTRIRV